MDTRTEGRKRFIINILYWAAVMAILYFLFNYVLGMLMPLIIGILIARLLNPMIRFIAKKTHISRKPIAFIFVFLFLAVIGTPLVFGGIRLFHFGLEQAGKLEGYYEWTILPALQQAEAWVAQNLSTFFPNWDATGQGTNLLDMLTQWVMDMIASMNLAGLAAQTPVFLLNVLFAFLFVLFGSVYYEEGLAFVLRQMSEKKRSFLSETIISTKRTLITYCGAYLKIMTITFVELVIGLSIILGEFGFWPIALSFIIACVDFLPVLGCGTVLIPWGIIALIIGQTYLGVGILLLHVIIFIIRQFIEPKIVGDQLGLNPLLALTAMYIGFVTMGLFGLVIMPIVVTVIADLQNKDKINVVK
jgi:sporulation integral membrane protein YtvI